MAMRLRRGTRHQHPTAPPEPPRLPLHRCGHHCCRRHAQPVPLHHPRHSHTRCHGCCLTLFLPAPGRGAGIVGSAGGAPAGESRIPPAPACKTGTWRLAGGRAWPERTTSMRHEACHACGRPCHHCPHACRHRLRYQFVRSTGQRRAPLPDQLQGVGGVVAAMPVAHRRLAWQLRSCCDTLGCDGRREYRTRPAEPCHRTSTGASPCVLRPARRTATPVTSGGPPDDGAAAVVVVATAVAKAVAAAVAAAVMGWGATRCRCRCLSHLGR